MNENDLYSELCHKSNHWFINESMGSCYVKQIKSIFIKKILTFELIKRKQVK